jgi:lipopolysaccharide transport system ATP-binding protein
MLGLSKREVEERFDDIVNFAELREFIDAPVKTYSSGMYMRLGFAVAIHVDPEVLLVDEVLAVGDEAFTHKCLDKFGELHRRGKTILIVTHSLGLVERLCDDAVWLDAGEKQMQGDPKRVVGAYLTAVEETEKQQMAAATSKALQSAAPYAPSGNMFQATEGRWGSREIEITSIELVGPDKQPSFVFHSGESVAIRLGVRAPRPVSDFVFGVSVFNADGVCCFGTNTDIEDMTSEHIDGEAQVTFAIDRLDLVEGTYKLDVAVHRRDGAPYDYHRQLYTFRVKSRTHDVGIFRPVHRWSFSPNVRFK